MEEDNSDIESSEEGYKGDCAEEADGDENEDALDPGENVAQENLDRGRYSKLAEQLRYDGWEPLVREAYKDECLTRSFYIGSVAYNNWLSAADEILATMDLSVLSAICSMDGSLPRHVESNPYFRKTLKMYSKRGDGQASIYVRALTLGRYKKPLTLTQAENLANHALHYAYQVETHAKDACKIDSIIKGDKIEWTQAMSDRGERRSLKTATNDIDSARKKRLLTFSRVLKKTVLSCRERGTKTVPVMQYVGYAVKPNVHAPHHAATGKSTNWLCLFVQAVLTAMELRPHMATFTVGLVSEECNGLIAEMLITRLARGYHFAGGFNIAQGGTSMASVKLRDLTDKEQEESWDRSITWIKSNTQYRQHQDDEIARRRDLPRRQYNREQDAKQQELCGFRQDVLLMEKQCDEARSILETQMVKDEFPEVYGRFKRVEEYTESFRGLI